MNVYSDFTIPAFEGHFTTFWFVFLFYAVLILRLAVCGNAITVVMRKSSCPNYHEFRISELSRWITIKIRFIIEYLCVLFVRDDYRFCYM
jgi:hypothetical protein